MKNTTITTREQWAEWIKTLHGEVNEMVQGDSGSDSIDRRFGHGCIDRLKLERGKFSPFVACWRWYRTGDGPYLDYFTLHQNNCGLISELTGKLQRAISSLNAMVDTLEVSAGTLKRRLEDVNG